MDLIDLVQNTVKNKMNTRISKRSSLRTLTWRNRHSCKIYHNMNHFIHEHWQLTEIAITLLQIKVQWRPFLISHWFSVLVYFTLIFRTKSKFLDPNNDNAKFICTALFIKYAAL